jgi:hypothetical protein
MHPIILEELAKFRQQDLLKEAESWRLASLVVGKKTDKKNIVRRTMINVIQRIINFRLFQHLNFRHPETLSPRS